jgi:hypothetical protein
LKQTTVIAADLGTVVKTIKVHRARVMQKMGVRSVAQLARLAAAAGIEAPTKDYQKPAHLQGTIEKAPIQAELQISIESMRPAFVRFRESAQ